MGVLVPEDSLPHTGVIMKRPKLQQPLSLWTVGHCPLCNQLQRFFRADRNAIWRCSICGKDHGFVDPLYELRRAEEAQAIQRQKEEEDKNKARFVMRPGPPYNLYDCQHCKEDGREHEVVEVPGEPTTEASHWGPGIPSHWRECTGCKRRDGPWVSAQHVGGCW